MGVVRSVDGSCDELVEHRRMIGSGDSRQLAHSGDCSIIEGPCCYDTHTLPGPPKSFRDAVGVATERLRQMHPTLVAPRRRRRSSGNG